MDLEQAFQSTSKVLFGQEIGKLSDFQEYLSEMMMPYQVKKSYISGKSVMLSSPFYQNESKFISQDEITQISSKPLDPNVIKDLDSLIEAVEERRYYCGNKTFGKCEFIAAVDNIVDCNYVSNAHNVFQVKYGSYLSYLRESEYVFGLSAFPNSKYSMRCIEGIGSTRCFESYYSTNLADTYYAFNCSGCSDCIFAFNLRSKRHVIGNMELQRDKYQELKKKLISEMVEKLKKNKMLFSIADISLFGRKKIPKEKIEYDGQVPPKVEESFNKTTQLVLGKETQNIKLYSTWLSKRIMKVIKIKGAFGTPTYKVDGLPVIKEINPERLVTLKEALDSSSKNIGNPTSSLEELLAWASKNVYFTMEFIDGYNENTVDTPSIFTATNVFKLWDATNSKYSAYSSAAIQSDFIFGSYLWNLYSQFCIKCYDVFNSKACFEVDCSNYVRNSYFCHNCENLDNAMFCFNVKSLNYAVCNTEVGREEFLRIKKILLDYINKQLDEKKRIEMDIFEIRK